MEKKHRKSKFFIVFIVVAVVIVAARVTILPQIIGSGEDKREVLTESTLKKIIQVSKLSTFTAIYNGIAQVTNEKKEIKYYVSYEATVKAGIDFDEVKIAIDDEKKTIHITLPPADITEINVDIASLDYMFQNKGANTFSISGEAFKACEADVENESKKQGKIIELATQNAKNILTALTNPIIEQLYSDYKLEVE